MEGYAAGGDGLAAGVAELAGLADALAAGLGPLVAGLAVLARDAEAAGTLEEIEGMAAERGREILRGVVQLALDRQAGGEVLLPAVTGADGVRRGWRVRGSGRAVVTTLGAVTVRRVAYRSREKGAADLHPRDAVLGLPPCAYSRRLQRLVVEAYRSGSCEGAAAVVERATGVRVGKRQVQEIAEAAAADAGAFAERPRSGQEPAVPAGPGGQQGKQPAVVMSADGKGVAMRPEALRADTARKRKKQKERESRHRLGTGQKTGCKRIAETGAVFDSLPPQGEPRTAEEVMCRPAGTPARHPKALNRRYACGIAGSHAEVIAWCFREAARRDPDGKRDWAFLVDGDSGQLGAITAEAARAGRDVFILIDLIHVLEYLWKAAWCFVPAGQVAGADAQVTAWALDILRGRSRDVAADITARAAADPPRPGSEHDKNIRRTTHYLQAKEPWLDYPAAIENGWPIATGVIEGACRHLIGDRMAITGARWTLDAAQAILWLRAIHASGDDDAYWTYHTQQEHHRTYHGQYQNASALAA